MVEIKKKIILKVIKMSNQAITQTHCSQILTARLFIVAITHLTRWLNLLARSRNISRKLFRTRMELSNIKKILLSIREQESISILFIYIFRRM